VLDERFVELKTPLLENPNFYADSFRSKIICSAAANSRIGITASHHHPGHAAAQNSFSAGRSSSTMVTWLEGYIHGSVLRLFSGTLESRDFGVRSACFPMIALPHHLASFYHHRTHHRVGRSVSNATTC
jgi:hypothetical protein